MPVAPGTRRSARSPRRRTASRRGGRAGPWRMTIDAAGVDAVGHEGARPVAEVLEPADAIARDDDAEDVGGSPCGSCACCAPSSWLSMTVPPIAVRDPALRHRGFAGHPRVDAADVRLGRRVDARLRAAAAHEPVGPVREARRRLGARRGRDPRDLALGAGDEVVLVDVAPVGRRRALAAAVDGDEALGRDERRRADEGVRQRGEALDLGRRDRSVGSAGHELPAPACRRRRPRAPARAGREVLGAGGRDDQRVRMRGGCQRQAARRRHARKQHGGSASGPRRASCRGWHVSVTPRRREGCAR